MEQATVFVWPRDHKGILIPTNMPRGSSGVGTSASNITMTKPAWVDHHLVLNTKSIAAQSCVQLEFYGFLACKSRQACEWVEARHDYLLMDRKMEFTQTVSHFGGRLRMVSCG